ncbi:MAG: polyphosphate kinase 2 family protein [Actinomycetota bacterium]|nr:polyphosphate kinase 2 family protein [Actinomycetota bacterium]
MAKSTRDRLRWSGTLPDPRATPGVGSKEEAAKQVQRVAAKLAVEQEKLFANGKLGGGQRVLLLLQGMDASGKDGTVKHVVGLVNPAGCRITSFGKPTPEELSHDFLWRITNALPAAGQLGVFNRSQYEDVLVVRVHELVPRSGWSRRFARINTWERKLADSGTTLVKVFLHISKEEQKERLLARLVDPTKHWKVGTHDFAERQRWDDYQAAYLDVLEKCSTDVAPWYVVPADRKWYRDWAVSQLLLEAMRDLDLRWPVPEGLDLKALTAELKAE